MPGAVEGMGLGGNRAQGNLPAGGSYSGTAHAKDRRENQRDGPHDASQRWAPGGGRARDGLAAIDGRKQCQPPNVATGEQTPPAQRLSLGLLETVGLEFSVVTGGQRGWAHLVDDRGHRQPPARE